MRRCRPGRDSIAHGHAYEEDDRNRDHGGAGGRRAIDFRATDSSGGSAGPGQGGRGQGGAAAGVGGRPARKVVLAWADTRNGIAQHDSVSHALAVIERLGYESGLWDTYIRTDSNIASYKPLMTTGQPASGGPSFNNVDAIFFMGHRDVPIDDQQKKDLLKFVHDDGKGFVAAHVGSDRADGVARIRRDAGRAVSGPSLRLGRGIGDQRRSEFPRDPAPARASSI